MAANQSPSNDDAFRFYSLDHPQLARTLSQRLARRRTDLIAQLGEGYAADWPDYKHRVGIINGLGEAIAMCTEIEQEERN